MLAPKYISVLRKVMAAVKLTPAADRVPGLSGWRKAAR